MHPCSVCRGCRSVGYRIYGVVFFLWNFVFYIQKSRAGTGGVVLWLATTACIGGENEVTDGHEIR